MEGKDVEIVWMPFELRPYPNPTLRPEGSYLQTAWRQSVYPFADRLGVEIKLPSVSPQPYTRLAHEGLEFAKDHGRGDEYNSAVMRGFFQQSENIGDPEVLSRLAAEAGLDPIEFRRALDKREYSDRTAELLRYAIEDVEVQAVPLFLVGKTRLSGVQPRHVLEDAIARASSA